MAFTTQFVMGAGGAEVEEIPVSMSGSGSGTVYPLATVDAGDGALIAVAGTMSPGATTSTGRPHLIVGGYVHETPHAILVGFPGGMVGGLFSGTVDVAILSRSFSGVTTFDGTVYVARM